MARSSLPVDTDPRVHAILVERWRSMGIAGRAALMEKLCRDVEKLARLDILARNPAFTELEVCHELCCRRYGAELADAAYAGLVPGK